MRRALVLAVAAAIALPIAACGGQDDEVEQAVDTYIDAVQDANAGQACDQLTKSAQESIERTLGESGQSCDEAYMTFLSIGGDQPGPLENARIKNVKVDGDSATANVDVDGQNLALQLTKEDGDWKIENPPTTPQDLQGS
jgi:hypothetical protein